MHSNLYIVKAFTQNPAEGNPAGVMVNADHLGTEEMQYIATKLGFSESVFMSSSENAHVKLRFFSPTQEVNLCGHGTIAAMHVLYETQQMLGTVFVETKAGILEVEIQPDGLITMQQPEPLFSKATIHRGHVAKLLGITEHDLTDWPLQVVSTGVPKLLIPIKTLDALFRITPDLPGIAAFPEARGFYPFTTETLAEDTDFHARQFNPAAGINEDPITGVAAGALGAYIHHHNLLATKEFIIEQGYSMDKPGRIFVDVRDAVKVGGYAISAR